MNHTLVGGDSASADYAFSIGPPTAQSTLPPDCVGLVALDEVVLMLGVLKFPFELVDDDVIPGFVRPALHLWSRCLRCSAQNDVLWQMRGKREQVTVVYCRKCGFRYATRPAVTGERGDCRHVTNPFKWLDAVPLKRPARKRRGR